MLLRPSEVKRPPCLSGTLSPRILAAYVLLRTRRDRYAYASDR